MKQQLSKSYINTPLGEMIAISDDKLLCLLDFIDCRNLDLKISQLYKTLECNIISQETAPILLVKKELNEYFSKKLQKFTTPLFLTGTDFQRKVWQELQNVPFGLTKSYAELAASLNMLNTFRAVANANGANKFSIIIPCHRIINKNGKLGGYASGINRKKWLLDHEKNL